jgi:hypothetical protein
LIFLSVIGFVLVVSCTAWEISTIRGRRSAPAVTSTTSRSRRSGTLRSRMEDRMRRRFDEN